jgi:2-isopropylmalate synthase
MDVHTGEEKVSISDGTGPVDASFKAISKIIQDCEAYVLKEYTVSSVTAGVDALGEVTVRLGTTETGRNVFGRSANTDVIVASAQAYVAAINRLICLTGSQIPTHPQFNSL